MVDWTRSVDDTSTNGFRDGYDIAVIGGGQAGLASQVAPIS